MIKKYYIILVFLGLLASSCDSWLDVNDNPNSATEIEPEYLFDYAVTSWSANRTGGDSFIPLALMNQVFSSGGSYGWGYGEDRYDISPYSLGNSWKAYYATSGNNIHKAIEIAEAKEPAQNNIAAQCKIAFSFLVFEATSIWGDIPFSEGWSDNPYPKFDAQKDVLNGVISLLDEAIAQFDAKDPFIIKDLADPFYGGNTAQWIRLANSLKLRIAMMMVNKDNSKAALIKELVESDNLLASAADNMEFDYYGEAGHENPKYGLLKKYNAGVNEWYFANTIIFNMMDVNNDPRIPVYFEAGPDAPGGAIIPIDAATEADGTNAVLGKVFFSPDSPDLICSYQEVLFFKAEAYARGLGVAKDLVKANDYFKQAIEANMTYYGVEAADIATFLAQDALDLTKVADPVKAVHTQQYIDLMDRPIESWVQVRRSGTVGNEVPNLTLPNGAPAGGVARRWVWPDDELTGNINAPQSIPHIYDPMWFDE